MILLWIALLGLTILGSALYSGGETGMYSLWKARLDVEVARGLASARRLQGLLGDEVTLLVTILIGNNLMHECATLMAKHLATEMGVPPGIRELAVALALTPVLFFFAELLPKDLFRRRPHDLAGRSSIFLAGSRFLFRPLSFPLRALTGQLERWFGVEGSELVEARGRSAVLDLLAEGKRSGALVPEAEAMARNALRLSAMPVARVMVPWGEVQTVEGSESPELFGHIAGSRYTRLPVRGEGGRIEQYLHQLDVLGAGPDTSPLSAGRRLLALEPDLPLDRALSRLRNGGQRIALIGTPEEPEGLVTLKDLVEEISGELAGW